MEDQAFENRIVLSKGDISLQEKLETLPTQPGVYQFKSASGEVLYVGKAINLRNRVRQYFQKSYHPDPRREKMVAKIQDVELIVTLTEVDALILETTLIKKFKPRYNIDLKDDKTYPYIVITNEPFPRVFATRKIIRDGSRYFGPYTDVKNMHASLKMVREIYKVRSCNYRIDDEAVRKKKYKLCFDYHIKKCDGPCEGLFSHEQYNAMISEVAQIIKGKTASLVKVLEDKMHIASEELHFEQAAEIRDKIRQLQLYSEKQKIVDWEMIDRDLFAVARTGDDACGVVFQIRDGKIIGRQHFYMTHVEERPEPEIVEHLMERYYLDTEDLPKEIFLPVELESVATLRQWLSGRAGSIEEGEIVLTVPKIGEKAKLMGMCKKNAQFLLDVWLLKKAKASDYIPHSVKALQRDLRLPKLPRRIECFDISNIQGSDSVASMVMFVDAKPRKSEYRKFKIKSVEGPDDFASMREVIDRRYTRLLSEQAELPDLIMVDGGKGQLSSVVEVLSRLRLLGEKSSGSDQTQNGSAKNVEDTEADPEAAPATNRLPSKIPVIGLAKRLEEVFVPESGDPQTIPRTSSGLKLLQQIRDEAHRFAITYHRSLRAKRTLQTELDLIAGVGKKRAKELLEVFGSVQGVKFATGEQLEEIVGQKVAAKIKEYFAEEEPE